MTVERGWDRLFHLLMTEVFIFWMTGFNYWLFELNLFTEQQVLNLVRHNRAITVNIICAHFICVQSCYPVVEIIQLIASKLSVTFHA